MTRNLSVSSTVPACVIQPLNLSLAHCYSSSVPGSVSAPLSVSLSHSFVDDPSPRQHWGPRHCSWGSWWLLPWSWDPGPGGDRSSALSRVGTGLLARTAVPKRPFPGVSLLPLRPNTPCPLPLRCQQAPSQELSKQTQKEEKISCSGPRHLELQNRNLPKNSAPRQTGVMKHSQERVPVRQHPARHKRVSVCCYWGVSCAPRVIRRFHTNKTDARFPSGSSPFTPQPR